MKSRIFLFVFGLLAVQLSLRAQLNRQWLNSYAPVDSVLSAGVIDVFDAGNGRAVVATLLTIHQNQAYSNKLLLQWVSPAGTLLNQVTYTHPVYDKFALRGGGIDAAGNLYFGGSLTPDQGNPRWFVLSFGPDGQFRWAKETVDNGSFVSGYSYSLAVSPAGDVYAGGYVTDAQTYGVAVKYDGNGVEQWTYQVPDMFYFAQDLALTPGGGVVTVNETNLTRLNAAGQLQWNSVDTGYYSAPIILAPADGNLYTFGWEGYLYYLRKYSPSGALEWQYNGFGEYPAFGDYDIQLLADAQNNVYVGGINSENRVAVAKFTPQGQLLWRHDFIGPDANLFEVYGLLLLPGGHVVVSGQWVSTNYVGATVLLNGATGNVVASDTVYIPGNYITYQKMMFNSGGLYVAGNGQYGYHHVLKYGATLSVDEEPLPVGFEVFPNPFADKVTVRADSPIRRYELYDMAGKRLMQGNPNGNVTLSTETLAAGTYLLRVWSGGKDAGVQKIIKK